MLFCAQAKQVGLVMQVLAEQLPPYIGMAMQLQVLEAVVCRLCPPTPASTPASPFIFPISYHFYVIMR